MSKLIGHFMNVKIDDLEYCIEVLCVDFCSKTQEYRGIYENKFNYYFTHDKIIRLEKSPEMKKKDIETLQRLEHEKMLLKEFNSA